MSVFQGLYLIAASVDPTSRGGTYVVLIPWKGLWSSVIAPVSELCGDSKGTAVERLVFGFSLQRPGHSSGIIHVGFLVGIWHWDRFCRTNILFLTANCYLTKASYPSVVRVSYHWPFETASGPPVDSAPSRFAVKTISSEQIQILLTWYKYNIYRVSIKSFPDYKHLLQENYLEYKLFFSKCNSTQEVFFTVH
jgi:hypothetical protein